MRLSHFGVKPKIILHLGAYHADEMEEYDEFNPELVIWVEANPNLQELIENRLSQSKSKHILCMFAITDKDDDIITFKLYNHPEASSIFDVGKDLHIWYPYHNIVQEFDVPTITVDTLLDRIGVKPEEIDFLSLDLQGAEMLAFKGAERLLKSENLKWVHSEIVYSEHYINGANGSDVCNLLEKYGFELVYSERHHALYHHIQQQINEGSIGDIDQMNVLFRRKSK